MSDASRSHQKHAQLYAILPYETDADPDDPIDFRITVKKVVNDPEYAEREVQRLNGLNSGKGTYDFSQLTRFEEVSPEVQAEAAIRLAAS